MEPPEVKSRNRVVDLQASVEALQNLPAEERVGAAMLIAAQFLEYAAYEMARDRSADEVSEIIHIAAKLDFASQRRDRTDLTGRQTQFHRKT